MAGNQANELILLDQAGRALAEARSLEELKLIRDKAEAVRKYAQSASLGLDMQNRAAKLKLQAERQAGNLLGQLMLRGGDRRSKRHSERLKLHDLGITPNQSTRWQLQARVPEPLFRQHVRQTCEAGKELTSAGLMRLARHLNAKRRATTASDGTEFREVNGHVPDDPGTNGPVVKSTVKLARRRLPTRHGEVPADAAVEIVAELRNHYSVLEGILQPLSSGEAESLHPAQRRVLRYLLGETRALLDDLEKLHKRAAACACHADRVAV